MKDFRLEQVPVLKHCDNALLAGHVSFNFKWSLLGYFLCPAVLSANFVFCLVQTWQKCRWRECSCHDTEDLNVVECVQRSHWFDATDFSMKQELARAQLCQLPRRAGTYRFTASADN